MGTLLSSRLDGQQRTGARWRCDFLKYIQMVLLWGVVWQLYHSVLADLAKDWWNEPALSYGMLIPPLAGYIIWLRRAQTIACMSTPDNRGLLLVAFACGMFMLGKLGAEFFLMRMSFVVLLAALTWTFWGTRRLKTLAFPFVLLSTMVPWPGVVYNSISAPLQLFASDMSARVVQMLGVSIYRDGNIIQLASTSLGVAEACSGLNSLSALMVGSLLLGYLVCFRLRTKIALFVFAIPLAMAVNILRIVGTAILADYNQEFAMGFYHSFSGWLVFVGGFGILYGCARLAHAAMD
jgi:exosortase